MLMTTADFNQVNNWMLRNARPLDLARWLYHFESKTAKDVLEALVAYQNDDGGMGHALEADSWNPHSTPSQCAVAVSVLAELNCEIEKRVIIWGLLRYLDSGADFVNNRWLFKVISNNDYPHAPWWEARSPENCQDLFNPSARLVGFILTYSRPDTQLYQKAFAVARELADQFLVNPDLDMHALLCMADLLEVLQRQGLQAEFPMDQLWAAFYQQSRYLINRDQNNWHTYCVRPSWLIRHPGHPLFPEFRLLIDRELDFLLATRNRDGIWDIPWHWTDYPAEFAISDNWWKASLAIDRVLWLKVFGRLE